MPRPPSRIYSLITAVPSWLAHSTWAVRFLILGGLLLAALILASNIPAFRESLLGLPDDAPVFKSFLLPFTRKHLIVFFVTLMPGFLVYIYRNRERSLVGPFILISENRIRLTSLLAGFWGEWNTSCSTIRANM